MSESIQSHDEAGETFHVQTFTAPIRALQVEGGKLYVLTDESVAEVTIPPMIRTSEPEATAP